MEDGRFKSRGSTGSYAAVDKSQPFEDESMLAHRAPRPYEYLRDRVIFLHQFLKHPNQVGSIVPSSRFLERRIIQLAGVRSSRTVVELGGGTGGTTQALLRALPADGKLLCVEINDEFCSLLQRIPDRRLIVHHGSAWDLEQAMLRYGLRSADAVVSGIPFSTMPKPVGTRILEAVTAVLAAEGRFLAYQVSSQVEELMRPILGPAQVEVELINVPPMRLYRWVKHSA
jgi:phosphatidylethanolamine/phosphatidyl-N-methylethanolamine N-methyltransferase